MAVKHGPLADAQIRLSGGRSWWAHFEFTRINIALTILPKKFEDLRMLRALKRAIRRRILSSGLRKLVKDGEVS